MRLKNSLSLLLLLISTLLSFQVRAAQTVIATVGGVPITNTEVNRQVDKEMPFKVSFHGQMSEEKRAAIRAEAIEQLIERAFKVCYAIDKEISVAAEQTDAALAKVRAYYKTDDDFDKAVAKETVAGLRASIYRDLVATKAESVAVEEKIEVTDEAVEKYYAEKQQMFFMPMQFQASHILIKVDPSSNKEQRAELLAKAEDLRDRAKAGENFYNLAYYNSDDRTKYVGGDLGLFHEGQTAKPFENALKKMQIGEISDTVKTRWGFHIIKLTQKNEPRQLLFAEMKSKIKTQLAEKQREQYYQQWMTELKDKYRVEMLK